MSADFYTVLGTANDATQADLKQAYRRCVREYHPDVNGGPNAEAQFKLVRKAHDVLSNPGKRKDYDRIGHYAYVKRNYDDLPSLAVFDHIDEADAPGVPSRSATASSSTSSSSPSTKSASRGSASTSKSSSSTSRSSSSRTNSDSVRNGSNRRNGSSSDRKRSSSTRRSKTSGSSTSSSSKKSTTSKRSKRSKANSDQSQSTSDRRGSKRSSSSRSSRSSHSSGSNKSTSSSTRNPTSSTNVGTSNRNRTGSKKRRSDRRKSRTDSKAKTRQKATASSGSSANETDSGSATTEAASSVGISEGQRRRRGLKRWYGVVVLSFLTYLGGLGLYASPYLTQLQALATRLQTAPVPTLTSGYPLPSPTAFAVAPVFAGVPDPTLALLAGVVALPLVTVMTVARFGRGSAWLYALGSIMPAAVLAAWPLASVPLWLALVGLVVLPMLGVGGFCFDVGRYLLATRT